MEGDVDRLTEEVGGCEGERGGRETDSLAKREGGENMGRERDRQTNQERWRRKDGKGERQTV